KYGTHPHPTQRGLTVNNRCVNIAGQPGADVLCVFEGEVSQVFAIAGYNTGVLVRHGKYITVYANLATVSVKKGDKITLNQRVGRLSDSSNPDDVFVHIEIWQESTNLNPEPWFRK
ncbi:MAG: M23 family metallopeptidase, partial [Alistipes sp.]|nr:M23 family metallopeptidase [Alistipes sp.]